MNGLAELGFCSVMLKELLERDDCAKSECTLRVEISVLFTTVYRKTERTLSVFNARFEAHRAYHAPTTLENYYAYLNININRHCGSVGCGK